MLEFEIMYETFLNITKDENQFLKKAMASLLVTFYYFK